MVPRKENRLLYLIMNYFLIVVKERGILEPYIYSGTRFSFWYVGTAMKLPNLMRHTRFPARMLHTILYYINKSEILWN